METLADKLRLEISRVRDRIMPAYIIIGDAGHFALTNMRFDMDIAIKALAEHDATQCIHSLHSLQGYEK